jgi:hypothetical protein
VLKKARVQAFEELPGSNGSKKRRGIHIRNRRASLGVGDSADGRPGINYSIVEGGATQHTGYNLIEVTTVEGGVTRGTTALVY